MTCHDGHGGHGGGGPEKAELSSHLPAICRNSIPEIDSTVQVIPESSDPSSVQVVCIQITLELWRQAGRWQELTESKRPGVSWGQLLSCRAFCSWHQAAKWIKWAQNVVTNIEGTKCPSFYT